MQIGLVTDSLAELSLDGLIETAATLGISALEFGCGNWSAAPHLNVDALLADDGARRTMLAKLADRGLSISALNCSGNPLHPGAAGELHRAVTAKTIRLAGMMGVDRVVMMSGCPGGPGDANANWVTTSWPPEASRVLAWQWDEIVVPYWSGLVGEASRAGVSRLCLELHGQQNVYNVASFERLRAAVGPVVGVNFDPSHLFWMGADPLAAIRRLGPAIYHVHAKDTLINHDVCAANGLIDVTPNDDVGHRAWNYVTLGDGHDEHWWRQFCSALRLAGYDGVLSIEHEDQRLPPIEGVRRSVDLLHRAIDTVARPDLASALLAIAPDSPLAALRAERGAIRDHSQGAFEQLVTPADPGGVTHVERAALALRVAMLEGDAALAARFRDILTPIATPAELAAAQSFPAPRLPDRFSVLLHYADLVASEPERCGQEDIDELSALGLSAQDIVAVTQLVAFVPYQVRLHAGLAALRDEMSS